MNKDTQLIEAISALEVSTIDDLVKYLPRGKKALERSLLKLSREGMIQKKRWHNSEPHIYSIKKLDRSSRFRMPHELLITAIHTALHRTGLLLGWQQGKRYWRGPVHPDAFCALKRGEKTMDIFVEADNATMNHKDIDEKVKIYLEHFEQSSIPFKVLFVTTSGERARNLSRLAEATVSVKKRKVYLFTTIEQFKESPLGEICYVPYENKEEYERIRNERIENGKEVDVTEELKDKLFSLL